MRPSQPYHVSHVFQAIAGRAQASVPRGELTLDPGFARDYLEWKSGERPPRETSHAKLILACCEALHLDVVCIQSEYPAEDDTDRSTILTDVRWFADQGIFVFWIVNGSFQTAVNQRGLMTLMRDLVRSQSEVDKALRSLSDQAVATMAQGVNAGVHGIIIADDIAYQQSTLMSPNFINRYLMPIWKDQVTAARKLDVPVFFHSDGNLNAVLPDIVAAGFDGLQCIEPAAGMDIAAIKETYGNDLCLMGNIDPALLSVTDPASDLPEKKEKLRNAVRDLLTCADHQGGLIVGTCSGLHAGMSPELVDFMYQLISVTESHPPR